MPGRLLHQNTRCADFRSCWGILKMDPPSRRRKSREGFRNRHRRARRARPRGESHCDERPDRDVWAGPQRSHDGVASRGRVAPKSERSCSRCAREGGASVAPPYGTHQQRSAGAVIPRRDTARHSPSSRSRSRTRRSPCPRSTPARRSRVPAQRWASPPDRVRQCVEAHRL
jgi:hypothetical protein